MGHRSAWHSHVLLGCMVLASALAQVQMPRPLPPDIVPPNIYRDMVQVDPGHCRIELENERVRVLRANLKGDEGFPMHDGHSGVLVCLSECHIRFTRPDRHTQDVHLQSGETRWIWADAHSLKNLSPRALEFLYVEGKPERSGSSAASR